MSMALSSGIGVAAAAFVQSWLDRYRIPKTDRNAWTSEGVMNVLRHAVVFERVVEEIDGKITSAFRSQDHNASLPGAAPGSRHLRGLALDVVPRGRWRDRVQAAAEHLFKMAKDGRIGRVHKVIEEPTWVHISWRAFGEPPSEPQLWRMRWVGAATNRKLDAERLA